MNIIPLNFAVFGACIKPEMEKVFDVHTAHRIARRRLHPQVRSQLTGILSAIVPSGKSYPSSWKFAFKDKNVVSGEGKRIVLVHEKYSSEHPASRTDFEDSIAAPHPTGENRIAAIPPIPQDRPSNAPYQLELVAGTNLEPRWVIHT